MPGTLELGALISRIVLCATAGLCAKCFPITQRGMGWGASRGTDVLDQKQLGICLRHLLTSDVSILAPQHASSLSKLLGHTLNGREPGLFAIFANDATGTFPILH